jgi:GNAT superfamily N-acetyltransferase
MRAIDKVKSDPMEDGQVVSVTVRDATSSDVADILRLGHGDHWFEVSGNIRFYEEAELREWIAHPIDNILVVAEVDGSIVGFFFCKVMSWHWAMLDNFYITPNARDGRTSSQLFKALLDRLQTRRIKYLTSLIEVGRPSLRRFLRMNGFHATKDYEWHELFLSSDEVVDGSTPSDGIYIL